MTNPFMTIYFPIPFPFFKERELHLCFYGVEAHLRPWVKHAVDYIKEKIHENKWQ